LNPGRTLRFIRRNSSKKLAVSGLKPAAAFGMGIKNQESDRRAAQSAGKKRKTMGSSLFSFGDI
jgi:hypothetical protein